jgi:AbrB family looped-hinge helix DNA binding protein
MGEPGLTLKLRVGRKGYLILPKKLRDMIGIEEGDELIVEVSDGIVLKPAKRKVDPVEIRRILAQHAEMLKSIEGRREPKPGELSRVYLEEEFE